MSNYNDDILNHYGIAKTAGRLQNEWTCKVVKNSRIYFSGEAWVGLILNKDPSELRQRIRDAQDSLQDDHKELMYALHGSIKRHKKDLSIEGEMPVEMMTKGFGVKRAFMLDVVGKAPESLERDQDEAVRDLLEAIKSFGIKLQGQLIVK